MEMIKRFLLDETATAEASSVVIMIAAVGILLGGALGLYYAGINTFFTTIAGKIVAFAGLAWGSF